MTPAVTSLVLMEALSVALAASARSICTCCALSRGRTSTRLMSFVSKPHPGAGVKQKQVLLYPKSDVQYLFFFFFFLHSFNNFTLFAMTAQKGGWEIPLQHCSIHPCVYSNRARHKQLSTVTKRNYFNSSTVPGFFLVIRLASCPAWRGRS